VVTLNPVGMVAVALVPILLKLTVTGEALGIPSCATANGEKQRNKMIFKVVIVYNFINRFDKIRLQKYFH
jgi:hypothetical protein